jgi:hypothetical protein
MNELPSMEEFEKLVAESFQSELIPAESASTGASRAEQPGEPDAEASGEDDDSSSNASARTEEHESSDSEEIEKSAAPRYL